MNQRLSRTLRALPLVGLAIAHPAFGKPIAYANGTTVMAEYGAGTMREFQLVYAPRYFWSAGMGYMAIDGDAEDRSMNITYARVNYLVKRWNMEKAQANIFGWGSLGNFATADDNSNRLGWNAGIQIDYETRRIYSSFKTDYYYSASAFVRRIDTLQLGVAPYEHDYSSLATWFVVQARHYTGDIHDGTEVAFLLRLFKGDAWIEAGPTTDGKVQAMFMFNF